jgi:hypothetical protein
MATNLTCLLLSLKSEKTTPGQLKEDSTTASVSVVNQLQQVEDYVSPRTLTFALLDKGDPMRAVTVQLSAPLRNFAETMTYIARTSFKGLRTGQIRTVDGRRPREVANIKEDGTIDSFQPFPREYNLFLALPYHLNSQQYQKHGVEEFFVDIAQSDKFSTLYHRCNVVFAPRDYKDELLRGAGILPYFQVSDNEFISSLKPRKRIRLLNQVFTIVDSFVDFNDKTIYVMEKTGSSSPS